MRKTTGWKRILLSVLFSALVCVPAFAATAAATSPAGTGESCRSIKVYQMDGIITIIGKDGKFKTVYNGMNLSSGDTVKAGKDSHLYLKIDNDKYLMAEPNTEFELVAEGTAKDSRTQIVLKAGAVLSRLDEKLSGNSSYEIKAANATMAIRGTVTRQELGYNPDGSINLLADLYEGEMEVKSSGIKSTGAADAKNAPLVLNSQVLKAGSSLNLNVNASGEAEVTESVVDYTRLSSDTVSFLVDAAKDGNRTYTISTEQLEELKKQKRAEEILAEQIKKNRSASSGSGSESETQVDKSDWATDDVPDSRGTAEDLPD